MESQELTRYNSVFDIPVKGAGGEEMFLSQFKDQVLMFVNTTGHCGNTAQWPVLDALQQEYKDKPFRIIYVPTNDYCGSVTFGEYKKGIKDGQESADYAKKTFGIEAPFTELVSSRNEPWPLKVAEINLQTKEWTMHPELVAELEQAPRSELYNFLLNYDEKPFIEGNFHKILTNKAGQPVVQIVNDALNDFPEDEEGRIS